MIRVIVTLVALGVLTLASLLLTTRASDQEDQ